VCEEDDLGGVEVVGDASTKGKTCSSNTTS
jgi:hypothetical protein